MRSLNLPVLASSMLPWQQPLGSFSLQSSLYCWVHAGKSQHALPFISISDSHKATSSIGVSSNVLDFLHLKRETQICFIDHIQWFVSLEGQLIHLWRCRCNEYVYTVRKNIDLFLSLAKVSKNHTFFLDFTRDLWIPYSFLYRKWQA